MLQKEKQAISPRRRGSTQGRKYLRERTDDQIFAKNLSKYVQQIARKNVLKLTRYVNKLSSIVMFLLYSEPTFWPQSKEFFLENLQLAAGKNEISWWVKHARRNSTNQFELNVKIENSSNYSGPGIICNKSCHVVVDLENISLWFCHLLLPSAPAICPCPDFFFAAIQCLSPSLSLALLNLKMLPINT